MGVSSIFFLLFCVQQASGLSHQPTPEEECLQSAPRTLTKALVSSLCLNATTYQAASSAVDCVSAVGRSLSPKLAVELCAVSGNAAGKSGGLCAAAAAKELTSLDLLSAPLRLSLCVGSPAMFPRGAIQCCLDAGKLSRNSIGKGAEWLSSAENRVTLCNAAVSAAPVSCIESFYSTKHRSVRDKTVMIQTALSLCSKATSSAPGECASHALDLPIASRPDIELIPQLCRHVQTHSSIPFTEQGPANCLKEAPTGWSIEKRVDLCANALDNGPAICAKLVKGKTSHEITEEHLMKLCRTPKNFYGVRGRYGGSMKYRDYLSGLLPNAAHCMNSAPPQMLADDKVLLCDPSAGEQGERDYNTLIRSSDPSSIASNSEHSTTNVPGPASCARAALSLRSYSDKAKLCRGASNTGPAECLSAAPYTMTTDMKVNLCSKATSSQPGKCASQVRKHILSYSPTPLMSIPIEPYIELQKDADSIISSSEEEEDGNINQSLTTVPIATSEAAAAGMVGLDPLDTREADLIAVELCHRTSSEGPSDCFIRAPHVLDESSQAGGHDLRASLCVDAEDDKPARCALTAYNQSIVGRAVQNLGAGVIVSLCHNVLATEDFTSNGFDDSLHQEEKEEENRVQSLDEFGPIACASKLLSGHSFKWWSSSTSSATSSVSSSSYDLSTLVLQLCSHAPSSGPALCAHSAPSRFTPEERVQLCKEPPKFQQDSINSGENGEDVVGNKFLDEDMWLSPALCASAAPLDIPAHKIISACKGATSSTPGHCLRASPGGLTSEDILRCSQAISKPSEVHVQVYESRGGLGDAAEARLMNQALSSDEKFSKQDKDTTGDSYSMVKHGEIGDRNEENNRDGFREDNSEKMIEDSHIDVETPSKLDKHLELQEGSSVLRVEATVVDQFQQPIALQRHEKFQVISPSPVGGDEATRASEKASQQQQQSEEDGDDDSSVANGQDGIVIDLDGIDSSSLRFTLMDKSIKNDVKTENSNEAATSTTTSSRPSNDEQQEVELFSRVISFALKGDVLNSIKVLFTDSGSKESINSRESGNINHHHRYSHYFATHLKMGAKTSYEIGEKFSSGISKGLRYDWMTNGLHLQQSGHAVLEDLKGKCRPPYLVDESECLSSLSHVMKSVDVTQVGEIAGAVVALPFRTGQGLGLALRTGKFTPSGLIEQNINSVVSSSPSTTTSNQPTDKFRIKENEARELNNEQKSKVESDIKQKEDEIKFVELEDKHYKFGPYFDIFIGIIFAVLSWGSIVYCTFKKLGIVSGGSQFGEGDFALDQDDDRTKHKSSLRKQTPFWRGRSHTKAERDERAVTARQDELEQRMDAALEHDAAYGLLGTKGGVTKRRKKFVLGAS